MTKLKDFKDVIKRVNKEFGQVLYTFSDEQVRANKKDLFETGFLGLDIALGGGIPRGKLIEVFGWEGVGKSTFALQISKRIIESGKAVLWIDYEHALNPDFVLGLGIEPSRFIFSQPAGGEEGFEVMRKILKEAGDGFGLVVVDSVAAVISQSEMEASLDETLVGRSAILLSKTLKSILHLAEVNKVILLFINQLRETIGRGIVLKRTPGGYLLKFLAAQRIEISLLEKEIDGFMAKFKITKNKFGVPYKETRMRFFWNGGFSENYSLYEVCKVRKVFSGGFDEFQAWVKKEGKEKIIEMVMANKGDSS